MQACENSITKLVSVQEWCEQVIASRREWKVIIDSNCHYHVLRVAFDNGDVMVLEELDSVEREDNDYRSQPCDNLMRILHNAWME